MTANAVLKISVPFGIEWVSITFYFDVTDYCSITGVYQRYYIAIFVLAAKDPVSHASGHEVFLLDPSGTLVGMASFRPLPQHYPYLVIQRGKGSLGNCMAMIIRPSPNDGVQLLYQILLLSRLVG